MFDVEEVDKQNRERAFMRHFQAGLACYEMMDPTGAISRFEHALALAELNAQLQPDAIAQVLMFLGDAQIALGNQEKAQNFYLQVFQINCSSAEVEAVKQICRAKFNRFLTQRYTAGESG